MLWENGEAKYKREPIGVNEDERDDQYNAGVWTITGGLWEETAGSRTELSETADSDGRWGKAGEYGENRFFA